MPIGYVANLRELLAAYDEHLPAPEQPGPPDEPVKQNGRSAAYLKHDKTKRTRR